MKVQQFHPPPHHHTQQIHVAVTPKNFIKLLPPPEGYGESYRKRLLPVEPVFPQNKNAFCGATGHIIVSGFEIAFNVFK